MSEGLSIIIPSFQTAKLTSALLKHLVTISSPSNIHIIVIDNGSTDGTKDLLNTYYQKFDKISVIINPENYGFTRAINQGIKKAEELGVQYHCLLNTDVKILNTNLFTNMIASLESNKDFGCIIPNDAVIGKDAGKRITWFNNEIGTVDEGMWYCVTIPQTTIDRIGILDERFFLHCSDSDFQKRVYRAGMQVAVFRNSNSIQHTCFVSSRFLENRNEIINKDRLSLNNKYSNPPPTLPNTPRVEVRRSNENPFLTILTRCYKRPVMLEINKKSIDDQTIKDFEQIFIIDNVGRGREYANKAFEISKNEFVINGDYVMFLDDDDKIDYPNLIFDLKSLVTRHHPNAIILKGKVGNKTMPPDHHFEKKMLRSCNIGSFSIVVKKELFDKYISVFGSDLSVGDFRFIEAVCKEDPTKVNWFDRLCCSTQRVSLFRPE